MNTHNPRIPQLCVHPHTCTKTHTHTHTHKHTEKLETRNTRSGMTGSQLAQVEEEDLKMSTVTTAATVNHRADPKGKNLQGTTQESLLRRKRELGVLVQIDIIEEREV